MFVAQTILEWIGIVVAVGSGTVWIGRGHLDD